MLRLLIWIRQQTENQMAPTTRSQTRSQRRKDGERPSKKARGDRLGKDVYVEAIQAVQPKFYGKTTGARGVTEKTAYAQATFKHDASRDKRIIYFEGDLRPFVLAAQRRHHTGRRHTPVLKHY